MAPINKSTTKRKPVKCVRSSISKYFIKRNETKGNKVLTAEAKGGFRFAWVLKSGNHNQEAFVKPFTDKVKLNATEIQHLNILGHCARRKDLFNNEAIVSESGYPFYQFVSLKDDNEKNSVEDWGKEVTKSLNNMKESFRYPTNFFYGGDLSEDEIPLKYLLNNDLYFFLQEFYEEAIDDGTFEDDEETQREFFGVDYMNHTEALLKYNP